LLISKSVDKHSEGNEVSGSGPKFVEVVNDGIYIGFPAIVIVVILKAEPLSLKTRGIVLISTGGTLIGRIEIIFLYQD
jgi:hypothetical protein